MNPSNHAYRTTLSTMTTLLEIVDEIHQGIEENKITEIMALDQTSAFDCVSHKLILEKLERYHIGVEARKWIKDYLRRQNSVCINRSRSVQNGTSVLGRPSRISYRTTIVHNLY